MSFMEYGHLHVSPAELLCRSEPVVDGLMARAQIHGQRVLVTGAGGSIGSELVRQVSALGPEAVYLLDHDENALHTAQLELHGHGLLDGDTSILADIRDRANIHQVMRVVRPTMVFHAAAHKHLPLLERYPIEALRTNLLGTLNVVSAARDAGVSTFVNISTDKAARPSSVLGATKRLAELIVSNHAGHGMAVASVRFGNVLGSHGSFLRSLVHQVQRGLPVTITDAAVTRFFMTIPEAAGLVIEASAMAEHGEIYVLDMGEPVRIVDLVQRYLMATGKGQVPIQFTGLRPGEKMHEELFDHTEDSRETLNERIWCVTSEQDGDAEDTCRRALALAQLDAATPAAQLRSDIFALLPAVGLVPA